jgi:HicA toxin of bacterial toxin-antitoxin,
MGEHGPKAAELLGLRALLSVSGRGHQSYASRSAILAPARTAGKGQVAIAGAEVPAGVGAADLSPSGGRALYVWLDTTNIIKRYHARMNAKQRATLEQIFTKPSPANVRWTAVESLFKALGATIRQGEGSRVRVALNERAAVFHRPHPSPYTDKGALEAVRQFLENAGVAP